MTFWIFFAARIVQGTTAVDFRLPEAARPVCVTGPGDEIFNRGFCWRRRRGSATGSKNIVSIVHIYLYSVLNYSIEAPFPRRHFLFLFPPD